MMVENLVELVFAAEDIVGESAVWDAPRRRLLWVDIVGKTIHALVPETGAHQRWSTPDFVTSIGLRKDGGAIVGLSRKSVFGILTITFGPWRESSRICRAIV